MTATRSGGSKSCVKPTAERRRREAAIADSIEIEVQGAHPDRSQRAARATLLAAGVRDGHLAISFVDAEAIRSLNAGHRGVDRPTDVLSFPVDGAGFTAGPRELGDIVICPAHTADLEEAVVHGVLHLCGYDHEHDDGEMLALQAQVLGSLRA